MSASAFARAFKMRILRDAKRGQLPNDRHWFPQVDVIREYCKLSVQDFNFHGNFSMPLLVQ
eukprot:2057415-Lingulodinium_polyedra.AAC.1